MQEVLHLLVIIIIVTDIIVVITNTLLAVNEEANIITITLTTQAVEVLPLTPSPPTIRQEDSLLLQQVTTAVLEIATLLLTTITISCRTLLDDLLELPPLARLALLLVRAR